MDARRVDRSNHRHGLAVKLRHGDGHVGFLYVDLQALRQFALELLQRHAGGMDSPDHGQLEITVRIQALGFSVDIRNVQHVNHDLIGGAEQVRGWKDRVEVCGQFGAARGRQ